MSVHSELSKNQNYNDSIKDIIIKTINQQKPQTIRQLVDLIQETTNLSKKDISRALNQLETEGKIQFNENPDNIASFGTSLFSFESAWYWTIIAIALVTTLTVFTIPPDLYPLSYIRNFLGLIFVLFLPGYSLVKAIFQQKVPIKASSESFENIERLVLSIAISIALAPMVGLILYYTPIGISLAPITLSLLAVTVLFASVAFAQENQTKISRL
jgi:hypothetical protein